MKTPALAVLLAAALFAPITLAGEGDAGRGGELYRACVACHTLEPGLHTSGPSLAGIMGRAAGAVDGFVRYSPSLRGAGFDWDTVALDAWIADPEAMAPGTYMVFRGIADEQARADLVAFLAVAAAPGGAEKAVADGLIPEAYIRGQAPKPIADAPPFARISAIRHCGDSFFITTGDGDETPYWEKNVRLKIDSAETGPPPGVPVILLSGLRGDRVSVIFSTLAELQSLIAEKC